MASESNISPISTPSTPGSESNISPVPTPSTPAPTLEPPSISLPYAVQHLVLQTLQTLLEHACHKYLQTTHPQLLVQKRWRIPQCAELNVYIHEILATGDFGLRNSELEKLSDIRHIAVHREPISEDRLEELMLAASTGALRLGDCKGKEKIARLEAIVRERQEARNEASGVIRNFEERLKYLKNLKECILRETEALEADVSYMRDLRDGNVADDICGLKAEIDDVLFDEVYRFRGAGIQDFTKILKRTMYQGFENFLDEEEMKRFDFHRESGR
ncbi:hypothetical protein FPQ18DRAFT_342348 [Pyronema domesticum]|nr:hypothetical protein FPQ18DRAFT_342348 [Pyronema domesticum]